MKSKTNDLLDSQLQAAAIEARSFMGESPVMRNFFDLLFEDYMTKAMNCGPGGMREVWMERAAGIRVMVDMMETPDLKQPTYQGF